MNNKEKFMTIFNMLPSSSQERILEALKLEMSNLIKAIGIDIIVNDDDKKEKKVSSSQAAPAKEKKTRRRKEWNVHGRTFPSLAKLVLFYGITYKKACYHLYTRGDELEDFLPDIKSPAKPPEKIIKKKSDKNGNEFYQIN